MHSLTIMNRGDACCADSFKAHCPFVYLYVFFLIRRAFDVSSNSVIQHPVSLCALTPATWYTLLVAAHNEAGATETEYPFSTLTLQGGKLEVRI